MPVSTNKQSDSDMAAIVAEGAQADVCALSITLYHCGDGELAIV